MKLKVIVSVETDDGKTTSEATNGLAVATDIPGMDEAVLKQDFLTQADTLVRGIVDNQIPALYAAVVEMARAVMVDAAVPSAAASTVRERIRGMKARKSEAADEQPPEEASEEQVEPEGQE